MLAGEYSILDGGTCLASTVNKSLTVSVGVSGTPAYRLQSDLWTEPMVFTELSQMDRVEPAISALRVGVDRFRLSEVAVDIKSNFDVSSGFGSSSAVTLGVLLVLAAFKKGAELGQDEVREITELAIQLQRQHQGRASGYDFLTQSTGGVIRIDYKSGEPKVDSLNGLSDGLNAYFYPMIGGQGDITRLSMNSTYGWLREQGRMTTFHTLMKNVVGAMESLLGQKEGALKDVIDENRALQSFMQNSPNYPRDTIQTLLDVRGCHEEWTFKTTGAGGEDALLLIGEKQDLRPAFEALSDRGWSRLEDAFGKQGPVFSIAGV